MNVQTHRLFKDLLSLDGYVVDSRPDVAATATDGRAPQAGTDSEGTTMNLFKSLWLLGGLQSIDTRVGEDEETGFGPEFGNRIASRRVFGKSREDLAHREARASQPIAADDARVAHC